MEKIKAAWHRYHNAPWEGSWLQRAGAWVLNKIDRDCYLGPTDESFEPRPTPWFARDRRKLRSRR